MVADGLHRHVPPPAALPKHVQNATNDAPVVRPRPPHTSALGSSGLRRNQCVSAGSIATPRPPNMTEGANHNLIFCARLLKPTLV